MALDNCQLFKEDGSLRELETDANGVPTPDMQSDFLSRVVPEGNGLRVVPVRVLGDIGHEFIDVDMLDKMAETLLAREFRASPAKRTEAEQEDKTLPPSSAVVTIVGGKDNNLILEKTVAYQAIFDTKENPATGGKNVDSIASQIPLPKAFTETLAEMGQQVVGEALTQRRLLSEINKASTIHDLRTNVAPWLEQNCIGERAQGYKFQKADQIRSWFDKTLDDMAARLGDGVETHAAVVERRLPESAAELGLFREHLQEQDYVDEEYGEPEYLGSRFQSVGTLYGLGKHDEGLQKMRDTRAGPAGASGMFGVDQGDAMINYHLQQINNSSMSYLKKTRAALLLGCKINKAFFQSCINNNLLFPMNFLILRPHGTWRGRTAIKMLGGGEAGNTFFAHGSAEVGHDANRMISVLHSVAYMAAIVQNAQYVYAAPNLMIDAYYGGLGMGFFNPTSYQKRSPDGSEHSIVVVAVPYKERQFPNPLDIAGRFYTDYDNGLVDIRHNDALHYSTAYRYNNNEYLFYTRSNPQDELSEPTVIPEHVHMNRICWQGAQYMYNRVSGKFDYCEVGKKARREAPCLFLGFIV
jgi:hypothetical protein